MATLEDIARHVGISRSAVSLALRDSPRIGAKRREQVKQVAAKLRYQPDLAARSLRTGRTHTIGLVLAGLGTDSMNIKMEHTQKLLVNAGYQVLLGRSHSESQRSISAVQQLVNRRVDGLILADTTSSRSLLARLVEHGTPAVLIDPGEMIDAPHLACVRVDRQAGTFQAVRHLAQMGHRSVLFCSGDLQAVAGLKWQGVLSAAQTFGLRVFHGLLRQGQHACIMTPQMAHDLNIQTQHTNLRYSPRQEERRAYQLARTLARQPDRPTAAVMNDQAAMAFIHGLHESGLRVPQDVAVVGYDDLPMVRHGWPSLTSVRQPYRALARHTAELLLTMIQGRVPSVPHRLLQPRLVIRQSSCTNIPQARRLLQSVSPELAVSSQPL